MSILWIGLVVWCVQCFCAGALIMGFLLWVSGQTLLPETKKCLLWSAIVFAATFLPMIVGV